MREVVSLDRFKGKEKLKEIFAGFVRCKDCHGLFHKYEKLSPSFYCLPSKILTDAITFNIYEFKGEKYFLNEKAMINFAVYHGMVPK